MPVAPVVLILHARPEATRAVFAAIRAAAPSRLFLVADGPRDAPGEADRVAAARAAVAVVDWPCRVERIYADTNLGCRGRVVSGLDAVFAAVDAAIVLEDDCLPRPGTLAWLSRMLGRWTGEPPAMMVTAANPLEEWAADRQTWHMARHGTAWAWATWRRAWAHFPRRPVDPRDPAVAAALQRAMPDADQRARHLAGLAAVADGRWDTWDVEWEHGRLIAGGLAVVPARNAVDNIGLGPGATHTARTTPIEQARHSWSPPAVDRDPPDFRADDRFDRLVWELRSGRHSPAGTVLWGDRLIARGRAIQALAMARDGQRRHPGDPALADLARRAAGALGRKA